MSHLKVAVAFIVTGMVCGLAGFALAATLSLIYGAFLLIAWRAEIKRPDQSEEG
jgi:hypothetical protein